MEVLLTTLTNVFAASHLDINWSRGKSEGLIALRGSHAASVKEKWRQPGVSPAIPVLNTEKLLHIVDA